MNAVKTIQNMTQAGMTWHLEGNALILQCQGKVYNDLVQAIQHNKPAVMHLLRCQPTSEQIDLMIELETINGKWAEELKREDAGTIDETPAGSEYRGQLINRAVEIWSKLEAKNPALLEDMYCLEPNE